ncbi:hypothetical protein F5Y16DRAFT_376550 [Xylariaceae sp. FL0255]|nr:hypothetical protein F5Y16DRAFT_376550 [Xylariaceae sp. FL0255]
MNTTFVITWMGFELALSTRWACYGQNNFPVDSPWIRDKIVVALIYLGTRVCVTTGVVLSCPICFTHSYPHQYRTNRFRCALYPAFYHSGSFRSLACSSC